MTRSGARLRTLLLFLSTINNVWCATPFPFKHRSGKPSFVARWYQANLAQEAESLQNEMLSLFNISHDAWQIYKNSKEALYKQACEQLNKDKVNSAFYAPIPEPTRSIAQRMLAKRELTARNITLLRDLDSVESTQFTLFLSDYYLKSLCPLDSAGNPDEVAVEAIIVHELMHIQNHDPFEHFCRQQFVQVLVLIVVVSSHAHS